MGGVHEETGVFQAGSALFSPHSMLLMIACVS